jgi:uncharacterized protein YegP (UPF0339 family)
MATRPFPSFLIFKSGGQFYWHYQAGNHKSIAAGGEGYNNLADCEHAISLVQKSGNSEIWETQEVTDGRK